MRDLKLLWAGIALVIFSLIILMVFTSPFNYYRNIANIEPASPYIWIDSNMVHKDSLIRTAPIYSLNGEVEGCYIRATYGTDKDLLIECVDTEHYDWEEFRDSWIIAFREAVE